MEEFIVEGGYPRKSNILNALICRTVLLKKNEDMQAQKKHPKGRTYNAARNATHCILAVLRRQIQNTCN